MSSSRAQLARFAMCLFLAGGVALPAHAQIPSSELRSGYADLGRDTKAMQDDDTTNPGMLWALDGEALWKTKAGNADRSCADCHGDAKQSMKGVSARFPAFEGALGRPITLDQRINLCRAQNQQARPFNYESKELLALSTYIGLQSRGEKLNPPDDPPHRPAHSRLRPMPRRQLGQEARRQHRPAGAPERLPAVPAGVADARLVAAASAQLHDRHARGALRVRFNRVC